ncbi:hypothetical protein FAI41_04975 [Acetobacteraceae bacterium]|nr:hypothetical protein FAI41_04975 [Acetobacteraceae bacterium]
MTALIVLAITLFAGLILYLINNVVISFNDRCHQKFYTKILTFKSYIFALLSLFVLATGVDLALFLTWPHKDLLSGILLILFGIIAFVLLAWDNVQKTNVLFATIGTITLFLFSLLTFATLLSFFFLGALS